MPEYGVLIRELRDGQPSHADTIHIVESKDLQEAVAKGRALLHERQQYWLKNTRTGKPLTFSVRNACTPGKKATKFERYAAWEQ